MTESPLPNPGMMKLGGVALAAYLLGRMKKGKAAVGLAMWAAGVKMDPKQLLRDGLLTIANSAEGKELLTQLRGPVLQAGRQAAGATIEGQVAALTAALEKRTAALTASVGQATEAAPEGRRQGAGRGRHRPGVGGQGRQGGRPATQGRGQPRRPPGGPVASAR